MAIRKELGVIYNVLISKAKALPPRVQQRTVQDIETLFRGYEKVDNQALLADILSKAQSKLTILELSEPAAVPPTPPGKSTFIVDNGAIKPGAAPKKLEMDFSNWYAGNVDPADLRKHKELLDRQHYGGPFWENRKRNPSVLDERPEKYPFVEAEPKPPEELKAEKEAAFEEVKR